MSLGLAGLLAPLGAGAGQGGGRVLFLAGKKIWTIPPAGGTARPIHRDGDGIDAFAATPSGRLIVYASGKQVFRLRGDGSRLRLVRAFSDRKANWIDVSADGQRILATLARGTRERIVTFRADGRGDVRTLVGGLRFPDGDAEFSPDRRWIVYARGTPSRIFKLRVGGGIPILLHGNGEDPTYSPNGQRIAFAVPDMGLWTIKADGSNPQQFFNKQELGTDNPTYSPNGQRIAFDALPETGSFISTVRINGTNQRRLSERGSNPEWTRGPF
jgi:dipeptidyl aminopeptidase/acylaminoacyl peptidase